MKQTTCQECGKTVYEQGGNLFESMGGVLMTHSMTCDWREKQEERKNNAEYQQAMQKIGVRVI